MLTEPAVIVTSGPSSTYPQRAYRNPTDALVKFLDAKHQNEWSIWEFRAEGTGYPDSEVYGRIRHYPWPDHHPPPFALIPNIMASMRNWLKDPAKAPGKHVAVVHCKAGKGRSGTIGCSYLISEENWARTDALARFTERRMRAGFGEGVSIPSQLRWVGYVERWAKTGKIYVEAPVEVVEIHTWGLRDGVQVGIEGFVDEGRTIKTFHTFCKHERLIVDGAAPQDTLLESISAASGATPATPDTAAPASSTPTLIDASSIPDRPEEQPVIEPGGRAVVFRPATPVVLPSSDVCIDLERRNHARYGLTMVTAVAHVWFNVFFEGLASPAAAAHPPQPPQSASTGVFEISWDAMDGIKGSSRKGTRALDRLAVVWRVVGAPAAAGAARKVIAEPAPGEPVPETRAADWAQAHEAEAQPGKDLGLRVESPVGGVSKANSIVEAEADGDGGTAARGEMAEDDDVKGVKTCGPEGEGEIGRELARDGAGKAHGKGHGDGAGATARPG
jgi:protein-tyrosine phosphatase